MTAAAFDTIVEATASAGAGTAYGEALASVLRAAPAEVAARWAERRPAAVERLVRSVASGCPSTTVELSDKDLDAVRRAVSHVVPPLRLAGVAGRMGTPMDGPSRHY